jgi:transposase-like protein
MYLLGESARLVSLISQRLLGRKISHSQASEHCKELTENVEAFLEEFPDAKVQRCQVHIARNGLCEVPHSLKQNVADDIRSIFYASSKKKSDQFYSEFKQLWEKEIPSAVSCLERSIDSARGFYSFP